MVRIRDKVRESWRVKERMEDEPQARHQLREARRVRREKATKGMITSYSAARTGRQQTTALKTRFRADSRSEGPFDTTITLLLKFGCFHYLEDFCRTKCGTDWYLNIKEEEY